MSFSNLDFFLIFSVLTLAFLSPLMLLLPVFFRFTAHDNTGINTNITSLVYFELPTLTLIALQLFWFYGYLDSPVLSLVSLTPYAIIFWIVLIMRIRRRASAARIIASGWCLFICVFYLHLSYLIPGKQVYDNQQAVKIALSEGDMLKVDSLWQHCPENIADIFDEMSHQPDYPAASFNKVIQCNLYQHTSREYVIQSSFERADNLNLLQVLYQSLSEDEKQQLNDTDSVVAYRLDSLKSFIYSKARSSREINSLDFLLKLFPSWKKHLTVSQAELHQALMLSNAPAVKFYLRYVQPQQENDILAAAVLTHDDDAVLARIKDRNISTVILGTRYNDGGDKITLPGYIIRNGSARLINFISNNQAINLACLGEKESIYLNHAVSAEFKHQFVTAWDSGDCPKAPGSGSGSGSLFTQDGKST